MPPAKKRRIVAASAAAQDDVKDDNNDVAMKDNEDGVAVDIDVVVNSEPSPPPPLPSQADPKRNIDFHQHGITTAMLFDVHRTAIQTLRENISHLVAAAAPATMTTQATGATTCNENVIVSSQQQQKRQLALTSSLLALSELKSIQRRLSLQVEKHANISNERRERVAQCSLLLENLLYERKYLQQEITSLSSWKPQELEKMAFSELGSSICVDGTTTIPCGKGGSNSSSLGRGDEMEIVVDECAVTMPTKRIITPEEAIDTYLFGTDKTTTDSSLFYNSTYRDPSHRHFILQKIQDDLQARASLVEQLSKSKLELKELIKKRDNLRGFLNQIPKKLLELERAGESLNIFFGSSLVWKDMLVSSKEMIEVNDDDNAIMSDKDADSNEKTQLQAANLLVHRASGKRTERFQMAQSNLPSPLYVLFVQLTGYIDAWGALETLGGFKSNHVLSGFVGAIGMSVSVVSREESDGNDKWRVVLTLSPTDILPTELSSIFGKSYSNSRSAGAAINIVFSFNTNLGVVLAFVEGNNDTDIVILDNLFPGDDGSQNPNVALSLLLDNEAEVESHNGQVGIKISTNKFAKSGKPYYWCQALSGLNFPPPTCTGLTEIGGEEIERSYQIQSCTKAVFRQLTRRIRAHKTLAAILDYLGKRNSLHPSPIPFHPALKGRDVLTTQSTKAKLHSWTEATRDGSFRVQEATQRCYIAIIKRKSSSLKATVIVDVQKYPAEPPTWSLQNEDGSMGMSSSWAEEHGNVTSLQQGFSGNVKYPSPLYDATLYRIECHVNQGLDKFVNSAVESTFDYILLHQLADIIACWDEAISACEGKSVSNNLNQSGVESGSMIRLRKGKERKLVGFGERSPFFLYRNGL